MGDFFGPVQLPNWNQFNQLYNDDALTLRHNAALASNFAPQAADLANQGVQQNLDDRATLRGLAPDLASADPGIRLNALTQAAVLPKIGTEAVNSLSEDQSRTAINRLALLQYGNSLPQLPYGGQGNNLMAPSGVQPGQPGAGQGAQNSPLGGNFLDSMSAAENPGGNPAAMNKQGFAGNFQFGTARLADLGLYQPAQGESLSSNQWRGQLSIPGFPQVKTVQDFLANPDAQRMAAEVQFRSIGDAIDSTPGAEQFNRAGLAAVAHLGGIGGMQQFVASGGQHNPHDNNGTTLGNYYTRFSQGGVPALQQAFGHPQGPLPADHPARQQVASNTGAPGMPQVATDVGSPPMPLAAPGGVNPPPGSTSSDTPQQLQAKLNALRMMPSPQAADANAPSAPDPASAANVQAPVPGMGMPAPQAVAQARQELDAQLANASPEQYQAAIQARALEIIDQSRQAQNSPAPAAPPAGSAIQSGPSPGASRPTGSVPPPPPPTASQQLVGSTIAPRPVMPGSSVMTTQPPADMRFPPPSAATTPGQPVNSLYQLATGAPQQSGNSGAAPAQSAPGFNPMAGLPPNARPIVTGPAGAQIPYTQGAPKDYAWAQTPPTADNPLGGRVLYRLTPPEVSRARINNPDGSTTILDTQGKPMFTSAPSTRDIQVKDYEADRKSADSLGDAATQAQSDQIRLQHALSLADQIRTGANGGNRAEWANLAETYLPKELADKFSAGLIGDGGAAAAQEFDKLMVQSAGQQERGVLGARGGFQATQLFMKANPGLNMQGSANRDILNAQLIGKQADIDYAQGAMNYFNQQGDAFRSSQGTYQPMTKFDQTWLQGRNPQIYSAAMGAAAGQPFTKWTEGLNMKSGADLQRVVDIVRRAKPNSSIQWSGGQAQSVGSN